MICSPRLPCIHLVTPNPTAGQRVARLVAELGIGFRAWWGPDALLAGLDPEATGALLVDVSPAGPELAMLERLPSRGIDLPVIVLARQATVDLCRRAFKAGAREFLPMSSLRSGLPDTLRKAVGQHVLDRQRQQRDLHARSLYARLSEREREVLGLLVEGLTNKEIARALAVSPRTVEVHRARLAAKLETDSLAKLVRQYADLVDEDDGRPVLVCGQAWGEPLSPASRRPV
ncbi:LuxR C-terminal-related transcriptional regulator [Zoogloea sp.]|uniref:response regulator transcription factor n=1 Tax=Zoogloea sp. TaxID=49181 RepID=UPI0025FB3E2F|nr:LuxR C-terminal-related transcriptional regulator [Zoogloea sp.]MCK6396130.1 LuxR C-terminal-related transcriptional regulator [Zoogloea sp.]